MKNLRILSLGILMAAVLLAAAPAACMAGVPVVFDESGDNAPVEYKAPDFIWASALDSSQVELSWGTTFAGEGVFIVQRCLAGTESWTDVSPNLSPLNDHEYLDTGLTPETAYEYRIKALFTGHPDPLYSDTSQTTTYPPGQVQSHGPATPPVNAVIKYFLNQTVYYVDDVEQTMDTPPAVIDSRTYLPLRYIVQPMGGEQTYDAAEMKLTVNCHGHNIIMWLNQNTATVDGASKQIDPGNPDVTPIAYQGRTMVPVRFVSENLGCTVSYIMETGQITLSFIG